MVTVLPLAPNVTLYAMQTDKFKTGCFSVNFLRPHTAETAELDALLPSVLLRATERWPNIRAISTRLDELYGAAFGTLLRRKGEVKLLGFYADFAEEAFLPAGEEVFGPMVEFLNQVLYHPLLRAGCFCPENVEGEKQNLINAIEAALNDKRTYATIRMLRLMCAEEAYGVPRLGEAQRVRAITPEVLWAHYQTVLTTSAVAVFYAGRRSPEEVAAQFSGVFPGRDDCALCTTQVRRKAGAVRTVTESMNVSQSNLILGLRTGITVSDPEYPALLLLSTILGGGMRSKLFLKVREELSLCYSVGATVEKYKGLMVISAGVDAAREDEAREAILAQVAACQTGDISGEEMEAAQTLLLASLRSSLDIPTQLDEFYMGTVVAAGDDIPTLMEKLRGLTVTDVTAAAQKLSLDTVYFLKGEDQ